MTKSIVNMILMGIIATNSIAQENITAEKELLARIPIGSHKNEVAYQYTEEGSWTPGAPEIDNKGRIYLFSHSNKNILRYTAGKLETLDYPADYPMEYVINPNEYAATSQEGVYGYSWHEYELEEKLKESVILDTVEKEIQYMMPWGIAVQYSDYEGNCQVTGIKYDPMTFSNEKKIERTYTGYTVAELKEWLPKQPGGFSIGDDGLLYRNGMVWSVVKDKTIAGTFVGRLASGHTLWDSGGRVFHILNSLGQIEKDVEIPWSEHEGRKGFNPQNYGIGPWGEMYFLIAPYWDMSDKKWPPENSSAELVVVRNYLKYFGRLNDGGVRLRKGPSAADDILGTYPAKTGFRILEKGMTEDTIGGKKSVWYKVRLLDGTEGWFFGAYVKNLYDGPDGNPPPWPNVADW